jgi:hypothetical protein
MSADVLLFPTAREDLIHHTYPSPYHPQVKTRAERRRAPTVPAFAAGQTVWLFDYERDVRCRAVVVRQSGEWCDVRVPDLNDPHQTFSAHVSVLQPIAPEAA